jgi:uncharacterized membrane protein YeaQ/YmgE (transglycosylase-associated protein family)
MIAVVNSVVIGTTCGLFAGIVTSNPMVASSIAGVIGASISLVAQFAHQLRDVRQHDRMVMDKFAVVVPTPAAKEAGYGPRL